MLYRALCVIALLACHTPLTSKSASRLSLSTFNVRDFGAVGDGVTDDRAAIQAALNAGAGSDVFLPIGTYLVGVGAGYWCLTVPAHTTLRGETRDGVVLKEAPSIGPSVRLLEIDTVGVTVTSLTLDGNKATQTVDEHRAGIFASGATSLVLSAVTARNFTGDGFYVHIGTNDAVLTDLLATANNRNGITFGGGTTGGVVTASTFIGNAAQQFDSEPGVGNTVDGVTLTGNVFDTGGISDQYVLTIAGSSSTVRSRNWKVSNNTLNGPLEVVWATDVLVSGNHGTNATNNPTMVYRTSDNVTLSDNDFTITKAPAVINVFGTGINQAPDHVVITRNKLNTGAAKASGVHVVSARNVTISDNDMRGPGIAVPYTAGVWARSTVIGEDIRALIVQRNRITNFGQYGVVATAAPGAIRFVVVCGNTFDDTGGNSMLSAISFDIAHDAQQYDNIILGSVLTLVAHPANGAWTSWGNGDRWLAP